ncbi:MAG TPA: hypothetical protein VGI19_00920 [Candidatus Cybelea sp.]|jgi:virginiamycin B lyase
MPNAVSMGGASLARPATDRISFKEFSDLPEYSSYYGPSGITVGPDKALWVTDDIDQDFGESAVVRVLPSGRQAHTFYYQGLSTEGSDLLGIATGSDGALWITDTYNGQILRLTTSGNYTGFRLSRYASPVDITSGPDRALWFTASVGSTSEVGRITTSGNITTTGVGKGAQGITVGPDRALWFCETGIDQIGRITTHDKVTSYSKGITPGSGPTSIAAGPDGALWFTERTGGRIGRITTSGKVTEYSHGISGNEQPFGIAAGPDGAMWFTEYATYNSYGAANSKIGRITMSGKISEYAKINPTSGPTSIVEGAKGDLWFVETDADKTGRVQL